MRLKRRDRLKEFEKNEREKRSPWNVVAFILFIALAVLALLLNGGKTYPLF